MHSSVKALLGPVVVTLLVAGGLVSGTAGPANAAAGPCQRTYVNPLADAYLPITDDGATTMSWIDVPENGLEVADIDVSLNVHYPAPSDLHIELQNSPDVDEYIRAVNVLYDQEQGLSGGAHLNMLGTVFDDQATVPISWGDAPYTGRFMPKRPFADMVAGMAELGDQVSGKYLLLVANVDKSGTGTLDNWSITLTYRTCDFDNDGVEDHADRCPGMTAHTASGCPVAARSLTATYKLGRFKGALSSATATCRAARAVTVWKVRSGPDRIVGTVTTRSDGAYRLARPKKKGRYYATSARVVVPGTAECAAVRSATFRIR
jgi:subtilisin-like proprotein convertase family protein